MMQYSATVLQRLQQPKHVGEFTPAANVLTASVGTSATGDVIKLFAKIDENVIVDACYRVHGSPATMAAIDYAVEWMIGKTCQQVEKISSNDIMAELELPLVRKPAALLVQDVVRQLVQSRI